MGENSKENECYSNVENMFMKMLETTEDDLARKFTNEELIKLCLKRKCRVDMWKWNLVNDYRVLFEEEGRYQKWNNIKRLKMLKKGVNIAKAKKVYSDAEIAELRRKYWEWELKDSILSLNVWEYKEKQKEKERQKQADRTADADTNENNQSLINEPMEEQFNRVVVLNSTTTEAELVFSEEDSNAVIDISSNTQVKLPNVANNSYSLQSLFNVNTESMTINSEYLNMEEPKEINTSLTVSNYDNFQTGDLIASDAVIDIPSNTQVKLPTVANNSYSLQSLFNVNTESMTINSEYLNTEEPKEINISLTVSNYDTFQTGDLIASSENPEF